jgi:hypothetical protein
MSVKFKFFRGRIASWTSLFSQAGEFASQFDPSRVISISHSCDNGDAVVTVWYWE